MALQLENYEPALKAGASVNITVTTVTGTALEVVGHTITTGKVVSIVAKTATTGIILELDQLDSLTTGNAVSVTSNSSSTSTRSMVKLVQDNAAATGATGLEVQQDSSAPAILVSGTAGGTVLKALAVGSTGVVFEVPLTTDTPVTVTGRTTANTSWLRIKLPSGTIRYLQVYD